MAKNISKQTDEPDDFLNGFFVKSLHYFSLAMIVSVISTVEAAPFLTTS
jgi:hypothetical protein